MHKYLPLLLLTACAQTTELVSVDGKRTYELKCGAGYIQACEAKAKELCGTQYTILSQKKEDPEITQGGTVAIATQGKEVFVVQCD